MRYRRRIAELDYGFRYFFEWLEEGDNLWDDRTYFAIPCTIRKLDKNFPTKKAALEYAKSKGWEEIKI